MAAGQQLAAQMFDKDVRAIFVAAGSVGIGSINEAKARMGNGEEAWIIGRMLTNMLKEFMKGYVRY